MAKLALLLVLGVAPSLSAERDANAQESVGSDQANSTLQHAPAITDKGNILQHKSHRHHNRRDHRAHQRHQMGHGGRGNPSPEDMLNMEPPVGDYHPQPRRPHYEDQGSRAPDAVGGGSGDARMYASRQPMQEAGPRAQIEDREAPSRQQGTIAMPGPENLPSPAQRPQMEPEMGDRFVQKQAREQPVMPEQPSRRFAQQPEQEQPLMSEQAQRRPANQQQEQAQSEMGARFAQQPEQEQPVIEEQAPRRFANQQRPQAQSEMGSRFAQQHDQEQPVMSEQAPRLFANQERSQAHSEMGARFAQQPEQEQPVMSEQAPRHFANQQSRPEAESIAEQQDVPRTGDAPAPKRSTARPRFGALDANGDGFIDGVEYQNAIASGMLG